MQIAAIILSLGITAVAIPMTVVAVRKMLAVIKVGGPTVGRTADPVARTVNMFKETFLHTRMLQRPWIGALHWFAYAAFLFLSTAVAQAFFQLFDAEFVWPLIGHFFLYEWVGEFLGLMGALAIIPLIVYRQVIHPRRLGRKSRFFGSNFSQAYFVEFMVLLESSAILFIRGAEYNLYLARGGEEAEKYANGFHFPIAQYFGNLYPTGADSIGSLENIIYVIATIKIVSAMLWLIVIATNLTMGVAWHRFTAWPNIWFKRESSGRTALGGLEPIRINGKTLDMEAMEELEEEDFEKLGVGKVEDFSWKGILDFTTCTECGRCQSQCPAWNTEKPLSPKLLMMGLREHAYAKAPLLEKDPESLTEDEKKELERPLIGSEDLFGVIDPDVLWSCTNCGACVQQCPVDIEHVDHIDDMRRFQVLVESNFPAELNNIFKGLERKGNPWGMNPKDRMDWAKNLDFPVKQVGVDVESLDEVEWLFWVGCAGAFEDRAKKTTAAVAELLNTAGVEFAVLGEGETCTGDSARRAGNEIVFMQLAMENAEVFKETKVKKVVSTCAHCFNTLKNEYAEFGVELEVVHHTQLLNRLVREGKLKPVAPTAGTESKSITYHDPCFLGRHNQVYEPPRELLQVIPGATFTEMPRNSETSFCCGAGGARMWMEEKLGSQININRTDEAIATGADQIAVGCPFCRVMLSDGLTKRQSEGAAREEVEVLDVAQMLLAAVKRVPEPTVEETASVVDEATAATAAAVEAEPTEADKADEKSVSETDEVGAAADAHTSDHSDNETLSDAETAAEHDVAVDDQGAGHSTGGEPGDTTDPEVESVPEESDDDTEVPATKETEGSPAEETTAVPDETEPVQEDAREEETETLPNAKADEPAAEKEDAAWANVGAVNTDLLPESRAGGEEPGDTEDPEVESVPETSDDESEVPATQETEGAPAEETTAVPDEAAPDTEGPVQKDAREEEAETLPKSQADVDHQAQQTDEDAVEEWVEEGGHPAPQDDETKP